jgi:hypothetical protein
LIDTWSEVDSSWRGFMRLDIFVLIVSSLSSRHWKLQQTIVWWMKKKWFIILKQFSSSSVQQSSITWCSFNQNQNFLNFSLSSALSLYVGVEFWLNFLLYEENLFFLLFATTSTVRSLIPWENSFPFFSKSHHLCVDWKWWGEGKKTFHHSTTGKTLSNQERLNMIKISSSFSLSLSLVCRVCLVEAKTFSISETPKIYSHENEPKICWDLSFFVKKIV